MGLWNATDQDHISGESSGAVSYAAGLFLCAPCAACRRLTRISTCSAAAFAHSPHYATGGQCAYYTAGVVFRKFSPSCGAFALIGRPARGTSSRCRHSRLMAWKRLWPPPDDDDGEGDLRGGSEQDETEGEAGAEGDAKELAVWLVRGLDEAGSSKKKTSAVRLELLSLDIPLASVVHCLFEVCRLTPPTRSSSGRPAVQRAGRSGREEGSDVLNSGVGATEDSAGEALPSKRAAYDAAVDMLLEYAGELMALASGSTSTLFDRLDSLARDSVTPNQDNIKIKRRPGPPGGSTLSASVRQQVDCMRVCACVKVCLWYMHMRRAAR